MISTHSIVKTYQKDRIQANQKNYLATLKKKTDNYLYWLIAGIIYAVILDII